MAVNNVINVFLLQEIQRLEEINNSKIYHRKLRDASNPFELPAVEFMKCFRLTKECALYVINQLEPVMHENVRITGIPVMLKILAALNFYGHGSYQQNIGKNHVLALSQPSISRCISEVSEAINNHLLPEWIKFPTENVTQTEIKHQFFNKYNLPGVIGAIDCTHIAIIAPPAEDANYPGRVYYNRKGYTSINTQVICDANLKIININARFPGSTHDSAIWMTSSIKRYLQQKYLNGMRNTYLIGDSGYPLEPWLMTPVDGAAEGTPESRYNKMHCSARNCIERFNGVFKSRFRALLRHRTLNYHPIKAALIIYSCAVLHNIANHYRVNLPDEQNFADEDNLQPLAIPIENGPWHAQGVQVRNALIREIN